MKHAKQKSIHPAFTHIYTFLTNISVGFNGKKRQSIAFTIQALQSTAACKFKGKE